MRKVGTSPCQSIPFAEVALQHHFMIFEECTDGRRRPVNNLLICAAIAQSIFTIVCKRSMPRGTRQIRALQLALVLSASTQKLPEFPRPLFLGEVFDPDLSLDSRNPKLQKPRCLNRLALIGNNF